MGWGGYEIYNFLSPYPTDAFKIGPVVLEKMLTQDGGRMTDNDGQQPIVIPGHPSDSRDLKIDKINA